MRYRIRQFKDGHFEVQEPYVTILWWTIVWYTLTEMDDEDGYAREGEPMKFKFKEQAELHIQGLIDRDKQIDDSRTAVSSYLYPPEK